MTKVLAGHQAPTFALNGTNGQPFSLADALRKGPVVAAFFKISCPVCQFTLPFLERLYETYGDDRVSFVAISQDNKRDTKEFCAEYDLRDRKSTRLNSSHRCISYAVFCLKKEIY